jgi:hypothetical protein
MTPMTIAAGFAFGCACAFAFAWMRAAMQMSSHGFDTSDEGNYLLAYRWWSVNHRTYSGYQYLYGPVFQVLGYDISRLRLFRIFTVAATHCAFGVAFMHWLRERRPHAPPTPLWEAGGVAAIVAASGMAFSWLPLSPGYNDVSLLGTVLAAAVVLRVVTLVERGSPIPRWLPAGFGVVFVIMVLAKWTSAITSLGPAALVAVATIVSVRGLRIGTREVARLLGWSAAGALAFLLLFNVFIVRLDKAMPEILEVNRLLMKQGNSPEVLLQRYWSTGLPLVRTTFALHWLLFLAAVASVISRQREAQVATGVLAVIAVYRSIRHIQIWRGLTGGTENLQRYPATIHAIAFAAIALAAAALVAGRIDRRRSPSLGKEPRHGWLVLGLLVILPITHGFGTGNDLYVMIVNGFAGWMALIIAIVTGVDAAPLVARIFGGVLVAGAVAASTIIARSGILDYPYRTDGLVPSTTMVSGVPALRSIHLHPDVARNLSRLHYVLRRYIEPPGRAMMGFDEMSGILLALDGRPVGESWAAATDWERTAEGLRASCRGGHPWWEARWPVLLFSRTPSDVERRALADCGIDFARDYRHLDVGSDAMGYSIYVPAREP